MTVSPAERRAILARLNGLASVELDLLWRKASQLSDVDFADFVAAAFPELLDPFMAAASDLAADWFTESVPDARPLLAAPAATEKLTRSARWALGGDGLAGLKRLKGTAQRAVFDAARDTIVVNAAKHGTRWARLAAPTACEFCKLLTSRSGSNLYTTKQSAIYITGRYGRPRGDRDLGEKYHDDCWCTVVEVPAGRSWEPPEYTAKWNDQYEKARANAGTGQPKKLLAAWRQLDAADARAWRDKYADQARGLD